MEINIVTPAPDFIKDLSITEEIDYNKIDTLKNTKYKKIGIGNLLNYVPNTEILSTLMKVKTKLAPGGVLGIEGYDLYELSVAVINDRLSPADYNRIIRGKQQILGIPDLLNIFQQCGFKILSRDIDSLKYYIEVTNV